MSKITEVDLELEALAIIDDIKPLLIDLANAVNTDTAEQREASANQLKLLSKDLDDLMGSIIQETRKA